jgi:hypothetical protein
MQMREGEEDGKKECRLWRVGCRGGRKGSSQPRELRYELQPPAHKA